MKQKKFDQIASQGNAISLPEGYSLQTLREHNVMQDAWLVFNTVAPEIRYVPYECFEDFDSAWRGDAEFDPAGVAVLYADVTPVGMVAALAPRRLLPGEVQHRMPAYLYALFMMRDYRCLGLGSRLLTFAQNYAKARGLAGLLISHRCPIKFAWYTGEPISPQHNKAPGVLVGSRGSIFLTHHGFSTEEVEVAYHLDLANFTFAEPMPSERDRLFEEGYTIGYFDPMRHGGQEEMFSRLRDESYREKFRIAVASGSKTLLVVLHDNKTVCGVAGSLSVEPCGRGFFQGIAVDPAHSGKKLGNLLFFVLCLELKKMGAAYMTLFVNKENFARRIYERAGFRTVCEWAIMSCRRG